MSTDKQARLSPDEFENLMEQVRDLIAQAKVKKAILLLLDHDEKIDPEHVLIQLSQRWESIEDKVIGGLLTLEGETVEKNKVTRSIFQNLKQLKEDYFASPPSPIPAVSLVFEKAEGKIQITWLYAKEDVEVKNQLKKYFFQLARNPKLAFVDVQEDVPDNLQDAAAYQQQIVEAADLVLCIVTENMLTFPAYDWAEKAAATNKLIPIRFREIDTANTVFEENTMGLPTDGSFIAQQANPSSLFAEISRTLTAHLQKQFDI